MPTWAGECRKLFVKFTCLKRPGTQRQKDFGLSSCFGVGASLECESQTRRVLTGKVWMKILTERMKVNNQRGHKDNYLSGLIKHREEMRCP